MSGSKSPKYENNITRLIEEELQQITAVEQELEIEEELQIQTRVKLSYEMVDTMIYLVNNRCTIKEAVDYLETISHKQKLGGSIVYCVRRVREVLIELVEMMNFKKDKQFMMRLLTLYKRLDIPLVSLNSLYNEFDLIGPLGNKPIVLRNEIN